MSHTPGPWKFEVVEDTGRFMGCKRLDGEGESTVIDLSDEWDGWPESGQDLQMTISKEDAALIEAAPEMLEKIKRLEAEKAESEHALGFAVDAVERLEVEKAEMGKVLLLVKVMIDSHAKHLTRGSGYHRLVEVIKNQGKARGEE